MRAMNVLSHSQAVMADNNNNGPLSFGKKESWKKAGHQMPHGLARLESTLFGQHMSYTCQKQESKLGAGIIHNQL
jgi:hypothetical protein